MHLRYIKEAKLQQRTQPGLKVDVAKAEQPGSHPPDPTFDTASSGPVGDSPSEGTDRRHESVVPLTPAGGISPAAFAAWHHDRSVSGSHSFASTNSSFLVRNFPKRYFILKSSTQVRGHPTGVVGTGGVIETSVGVVCFQEELDHSVQTGTWRTQLHNEPVLDQAYRTSPEVSGRARHPPS
jgi:hypothetical protein